MITDALTRVSNGQLVTVTAVSASSIDTGDALLLTKQVAAGNPIYCVITVAGDVTAAGAATVTFEVITATDALLTAGIQVLAVTEAIGIADLNSATAVLAPIVMCLKPDVNSVQDSYLRFLGVRYTVATGPLTVISAFNADFVVDYADARTHYRSGYTF